MAAHAYWRIYVTANNGDATYTEIVEMEMRAYLNGPDQCNGGTALSSTPNYSGPAGAFDNNYTATYWNSSAGVPCWCGYQFTAPVEVIQIAITDTYPSESGRAPKNFYIQYSDDGTNWTTSNTITNQTGWGTCETRLFYAYATNYALAGNITESLPITNWRVSAYSCKDGVELNTVVSTSSTYSVGYLPKIPCNITIAPQIDAMWSASAVITSGQVTAGYYIVATAPDTTQYIFQVTTAGTFGSTEPTWNTTIGVTTASGTATLTCLSALVNPMTLGPKIPA